MGFRAIARPRTPILALCLALGAALPLCAGGQKEPGIVEAIRLIDERDYTAAIKLLAELRLTNPDLKDATQQLLDRINRLGQEYNQVLDDLHTALYVENDVPKAERLMAQLQSLDPGRSVQQAQQALQFIRFLQQMSDAEALLSQGRFADALSSYILPVIDPARAGMNLERPGFETSGFGPLVTTSVSDAVKRLQQLVNTAQSQASQVDASLRKLPEFLASPATDRGGEELNGILSPLLAAIRTEGALRALAASISTTGNSLKASSKGQIPPFLQYLLWLLGGRPDRSEGIIVAVRGIYGTATREAMQQVAASMTSSFTLAVSRIDSADPRAARAAFVELSRRSPYVATAAGVAAAALRTSAADGWALSGEDGTLARQVLSQVALAEEQVAEIPSFLTLLDLKSSVTGLPPASDATADTLARARGSIEATAQTADETARQARLRADAWAAKASTGVSVQPAVDAAVSVASRFTAFSASLHDVDLGYALGLARVQAASFEDRVRDALSATATGKDRMYGTIGGKQPAAEVFVPVQPLEAMDLFDSTTQALLALQAEVTSYRSRWRSDKPWVSSSGGIATLLKGMDGLDGRINAQKTELARLSALAANQHQQALARRRVGDIGFNEGSRVIKARQVGLFENARTQLNDARDAYTDSLALEEDARTRGRLDPEIPDLLAQIAAVLYQQWLAEVDKLIDEGRVLFQRGEFLKSYNVVQSAESRWKETHPDKAYSALDTLLAQVTNALRLSWGRDLSPEDSRAPVVNAFLSQANAGVADAEKLKKGDDRRAALLQKAAASVQSALDVAPVYRTAKLVQFRIRKDLASNDRAFIDEARAEVAAILKDYQARKGDRPRVYYDLKDYGEIVPDYPGVKEALAQLEIELGFRMKPISITDIAAARDKYNQASTLYNAANALTFDPALQLLDSALNLNPGYPAARSLRLAILLKQGNPEVSSISQADLARYAKARLAYGTADYADAYTILHDMIGSNPKNGSYPPIAKLYLLAQQKLGLK